jgi:hypothetical protein
VSVPSSAIETLEAGIYQIDPEGSSIAVTTKHMFGLVNRGRRNCRAMSLP